MKTDEQIKKEYYESQGLNTQDCSRAYLQRKVKADWIKKKYKHISKVYALDKKSLFCIANSNNLSI